MVSYLLLDLLALRVDLPFEYGKLCRIYRLARKQFVLQLSDVFLKAGNALVFQPDLLLGYL